MCRGERSCVELGEPANWSRLAPLPPPALFAEEQLVVVEAIRLAAEGEAEAASATLSRVRSDELRNWYVKHGHASGRLRYRLAGRPGHGVSEAVRVPPASPASLASAVFTRDSYSCRYCGLRLFPRRVLVAFGRIVGTEQFGMGGTNALRHGAVVGFQAVADHVLPWNLGGRSEMDNLVTACWCCNFGKAGYTLEQLGLDDPRDREPVRSDWDGLVGLLPALRLAGRRERRTG